MKKSLFYQLMFSIVATLSLSPFSDINGCAGHEFPPQVTKSKKEAELPERYISLDEAERSGEYFIFEVDGKGVALTKKGLEPGIINAIEESNEINNIANLPLRYPSYELQKSFDEMCKLCAVNENFILFTSAEGTSRIIGNLKLPIRKTITKFHICIINTDYNNHLARAVIAHEMGHMNLNLKSKDPYRNIALGSALGGAVGLLGGLIARSKNPLGMVYAGAMVGGLVGYKLKFCSKINELRCDNFAIKVLLKNKDIASLVYFFNFFVKHHETNKHTKYALITDEHPSHLFRAKNVAHKLLQAGYDIFDIDLDPEHNEAMDEFWSSLANYFPKLYAQAEKRHTEKSQLQCLNIQKKVYCPFHAQLPDIEEN